MCPPQWFSMRPFAPRAKPAPSHWAQLPLGPWLSAQISAQLAQLPPFSPHARLATLGYLSQQLQWPLPPSAQRLAILPSPHAEPAPCDLYGDFSALPLKNGALDGCLLAHQLAWQPQPHAVLREIERVLVDDGWLMITGFNPLGWVSVKRYAPFNQQRLDLGARLYHPQRIIDWLQLLGFEIYCDVRLGHTLMTLCPQLCARWPLLLRYDALCASSYFIAAQKRRVPLTPARPHWQPLPSLSPEIATGMALQG
ncbi:MAG: class I SAM-dependent methyltransferase [Aeromonas sp.]